MTLFKLLFLSVLLISAQNDSRHKLKLIFLYLWSNLSTIYFRKDHVLWTLHPNYTRLCNYIHDWSHAQSLTNHGIHELNAWQHFGTYAKHMFSDCIWPHFMNRRTQLYSCSANITFRVFPLIACANASNNHLKYGIFSSYNKADQSHLFFMMITPTKGARGLPY